MLSLGIVGLPNVGKSTLFNTLTKAKKAESANYPFCTIEPNVGVVEVPDPRLARLTAIYQPKRVVPTSIKFVDIAGLVAGASKGEGLGNQFLANIREVDGIVHVVRYFEDPDVTHVAGAIDPARDIEIIETELILADMATVEKALDKAEKQAKAGDKKLVKRAEVIRKLSTVLDEGKVTTSADLDEEELEAVKELHLLTMKPVIYMANISEKQIGEEVEISGIDSPIIPVCAELEQELLGLTDTEISEMLAGYGLAESGLDKVISVGYRSLGLITFLTGGPEEVRAWTVKRHATAPQAAGVIHTDFQDKFIRAEVIKYADLDAAGSEKAASDGGKLRVEGKNYVVEDGDVMHFLHGA